MVKKRIVIFSLILLCSSVVRANVNQDTLIGDGVSDSKKDPGMVLKELQDGSSLSLANETSVPSLDSEVRCAKVNSSIAVLENALGHLTGALASEFLSSGVREKIEKEIEAHQELVAVAIDLLAEGVVDTLKTKTVFAPQDVLAVIVECHDPQNREAIVDRSLELIFRYIADLNAEAGRATTKVERVALNAKRKTIENIEAAFCLAKAKIAQDVPSVCKSSHYNVALGSVCFLAGGALMYLLQKVAPRA